MFRRAVNNHNVPPPVSAQPILQQRSLSSFTPTSNAQTSVTRPLSTGSGNVVKHNTNSELRSSGPARGMKRTSSGLAKALSSQEDVFHYPSLNMSETENNLPSKFHSVAGNPTAAQPPVFFEENDFDSDPDLDAEDPATIQTVHYPTLPKPKLATASGDSAYASLGRDSISQPEIDSSQAIPWSSSPLSHFQSPPKPKRAVQPSKRRTLPWLGNQSQTQSGRSAASGFEAESEEEPDQDSVRPKKRRSGGHESNDATPPAHPTKDMYPWNTTASAVKQQQKSLREANKRVTKANEGTEDEAREAIVTKKKPVIHRIFLSDEQKHVLNLVVERQKSVFFTGSAGTGKSVLLREIISALRKKYVREPDRVAVTASTGLAACNVGGVTLHSFGGIGLGKESAEDLVKKIRKNQKARQRWLRTKVLVIDEVSMVDGDLFDKLEQIARTMRSNGRPFGGIQLVITGDFFQLPPIGEKGRSAKFAFNAGTWNTTVEYTIGLHRVFRQKDPEFADMLNEMREGRMSAESIAKFKKLDRPLPASDDSIEATELFPMRAEVERANSLRMQRLHGQTFDYDARDGGALTNKEHRDKWLQNCIAPERVSLKKGAQVMLIKNMDETLVNGSLGKVTGFMTDEIFNMYREHEESFLHGGKDFQSENALAAQQKAALLGVNTQQAYPVVRFALPDGTTRDLHCKRESWKYEQPNGEVLASREQIPLILAWALSIHKAQGQTLERVRVDLGRAFEKGQAYVALSRATNMAGLQVMRFIPSKVQAHPLVAKFYKSLARAEQANEAAKNTTIIGKMMNKKSAVDCEQEFVNS